jgi:ABC-type multidrug transport system fused ATPase/permease subunit
LILFFTFRRHRRGENSEPPKAQPRPPPHTKKNSFQNFDNNNSDPPSPRGGFILPSVEGAIELRDVTFRYPDAARKAAAEAAAAAASGGSGSGSVPRPVLDALSLSIPARWSVALVGGSGCGKSTVLQLLQRVHSPQQGRVLLDGQSVSSLDLDWYRRQVGSRFSFCFVLFWNFVFFLPVSFLFCFEPKGFSPFSFSFTSSHRSLPLASPLFFLLLPPICKMIHK